MKNSKLFLKIPETAKNFPTETWISQKFPNPSDFPAQTKNSQFGILKSQFGYPEYDQSTKQKKTRTSLLALDVGETRVKSRNFIHTQPTLFFPELPDCLKVNTAVTW